MKHIDLGIRPGLPAGPLDPSAYLLKLGELATELPPGARAFATDPEHYAFTGRRCVKDLVLASAGGPDASSDDLELRFRHNCWKHDEDLVLRYTGVTDVRIDAPNGGGWDALDAVILDEVLPHVVAPDVRGARHEIAFRPGTLLVTCHDLTATWIAADCPDLMRR